MDHPVASVIDTVVNLAKRRGFVYPSGEIYGGTKSAWDYGPLGVELKENIKRQWWRTVVTGRDDVVGHVPDRDVPRRTRVDPGPGRGRRERSVDRRRRAGRCADIGRDRERGLRRMWCARA